MSTAPPPDERWSMFIGGLDALGRPRPMTLDVLIDLADSWPVTSETPDPVTALLATARKTFVLAWFHYELLVVASTWALMAVEAGVRIRLEPGGKTQLARLLKQAQREALISAEQVQQLDTARRLRNELVHVQGQGSWTLGMAAPVMRASHESVMSLFPTTPFPTSIQQKAGPS